jgi:hypothetical protein
VTDLRVHLLDDFADELPNVVNFEVGYYEKRSKCMIKVNEDLDRMYAYYKAGEEVLLWCDADSGRHSGSEKSRKRKRIDSDEEDDMDMIYRELKEKHGEQFTVPQLRLWARMLYCDSYDDYNKPPPVPIFSGSLPKRQKKESVNEAIAGGLLAISRAVSPCSNVSPPPVHPCSAASSSSAPSCNVGISPSKCVELRMKNFQQLRYIQQLLQDGILSEQEFLEQKREILDALKKFK